MVKPFQPSTEFLIETSQLIFSANQTTGFYMKWKSGLKWVKRNCCYDITMDIPEHT